MSYFVSPPEATHWSISHVNFVKVFHNRWSDADINYVSNPQSNHAVVWRILLNGQLVEGSLDRAGQAIHLDGDIFSSAEFTLWFRSIVPSEQALVFYDESYSADVSLTETTTIEELTKPFLR